MTQDWLSYKSTLSYNAPFDDLNYSTAETEGDMTYVVSFEGIVDTIAFGNLYGDTVSVVFKNSGGTAVTTLTDVPIDGSVDDEGRHDDAPTCVILYADSDIEGGTIEVTVNSTTTAELGTMKTGLSVSGGWTNFAVNPSFVDYSKYEPDEWGYVQYVERAKVSSVDGTVDVLSVDAAKLNRLMKQLGGSVVIVNGSDFKNYGAGYEDIYSVWNGIGRLQNYKLATKEKNRKLDDVATYTLRLEEGV